MKKIIASIFIIFGITALTAEPYRPYPVVMIHGYNTDNYNASNFGITILSDSIKANIANPTTPSPVPAKINNIEDDYYISRNEGKRKTHLAPGVMQYQT
ncbi:MAG: hypothetical protein AB7T10_06840 [bacterium]